MTAAAADGAPLPAAGFRHEAMLYAGERGFANGALSFLREGLAFGHAALVVVAPPKIALLRGALGDDARHVRFEDMTRVGANPARIIPAWKDFAERDGHGDRPLRGIGEPVSADRSGAELFECHRHESLLNLAFAGAADFRLLCPYDTAALDAAVVAEARRTHPLVTERPGDVRASACFHGLDAAAQPCTAPLPPAPPHAQRLPVDVDGLATVRAAVTRHAARGGLAPARIEDLVLAVNELATNSVVHGGGSGVLRVWHERAPEPGALVCEVRDAGTLAEPLAGRHRPAAGQVGHYGLWLVNQLCDFVEQRTVPGGGNVVRVTMRGE